jgi:hypothetical protein
MGSFGDLATFLAPLQKRRGGGKLGVERGRMVSYGCRRADPPSAGATCGRAVRSRWKKVKGKLKVEKLKQNLKK